jgi:dolichol-phosphate mannosyltransferase
MGQVELSFVVPAYNEEESIEAALVTIDDLVKTDKTPYEIVVVNDGSEDETFSKAFKYSQRHGHVRIISYKKNEGKGHAIKAGFMLAEGDVVVFADSDLDIDMTMIANYVEALKKGDIVIASKWHPCSQVRLPFSRKLLSHSFNVLVRLLTGAKLKDTQVGLKVIKRNAFEKIFSKLAVKRYAFDVELLAVASLYGLKIIEMPVNIDLDASFKTKEVWKMFLDLLGIAYRLRVLHSY